LLLIILAANTMARFWRFGVNLKIILLTMKKQLLLYPLFCLVLSFPLTGWDSPEHGSGDDLQEMCVG
jgi:hypothetical protein